MKLEEKFNKGRAKHIEVVPPSVQSGPQYDLGVRATFYAQHDTGKGQIAMHMAPLEALEFASQLIAAATRQLKYEQDREARAK